MSGQTSITPKDFAIICCKASEIREASWNNSVISARDRYTKDWDQAARQACEELGYNPQWAGIIKITLFPEYCDVWDWCSEVGAELDQAPSPSGS